MGREFGFGTALNASFSRRRGAAVGASQDVGALILGSSRGQPNAIACGHYSLLRNSSVSLSSRRPFWSGLGDDNSSSRARMCARCASANSFDDVNPNLASALFSAVARSHLSPSSIIAARSVKSLAQGGASPGTNRAAVAVAWRCSSAITSSLCEEMRFRKPSDNLEGGLDAQLSAGKRHAKAGVNELAGERCVVH